MYPVCLGAAALIVAGETSAGGLTVLALKKRHFKRASLTSTKFEPKEKPS